MEETIFGHTDCPNCGRTVVVLAEDVNLEWEYMCPGTEFKPCGKAFKFKRVDDVEE